MRCRRLSRRPVATGIASADYACARRPRTCGQRRLSGDRRRAPIAARAARRGGDHRGDALRRTPPHRKTWRSRSIPRVICWAAHRSASPAPTRPPSFPATTSLPRTRPARRSSTCAATRSSPSRRSACRSSAATNPTSRCARSPRGGPTTGRRVRQACCSPMRSARRNESWPGLPTHSVRCPARCIATAPSSASTPRTMLPALRCPDAPGGRSTGGTAFGDALILAPPSAQGSTWMRRFRPLPHRLRLRLDGDPRHPPPPKP